MTTLDDLAKTVTAVAETRGSRRVDIAKVSLSGEWTNGMSGCLWGEAIMRHGGKFEQGTKGYIPADMRTVELCELALPEITRRMVDTQDSPADKKLGQSIVTIKQQRLDEAKTKL